MVEFYTPTKLVGYTQCPLPRIATTQILLKSPLVKRTKKPPLHPSKTVTKSLQISKHHHQRFFKLPSNEEVPVDKHFVYEPSDSPRVLLA